MISEFSETRGVVVCRLSGEARQTAKEELASAMQELVQRGAAGRCLINMEGVTYMNSLGLSLLISTYRQVKGRGGRLGLCCLSSNISNLFDVTHLNRYFEIFSDQEKALASLAG